MEGACGKILDTDDPKIVLKKLHRRNRAQQRTCSLKADEQAKMQMWASNACSALGLSLLFVPKAWALDAYSYKMERIDVSKPLQLTEVKSHPVLQELQRFFQLSKKQGIFPADFELYVQPDGKVALVDFDKFATWSQDGTIIFPWGLRATDAAIQQEYPFLFL
jgi:hypothetical protein